MAIHLQSGMIHKEAVLRIEVRHAQFQFTRLQIEYWDYSQAVVNSTTQLTSECWATVDATPEVQALAASYYATEKHLLYLIDEITKASSLANAIHVQLTKDTKVFKKGIYLLLNVHKNWDARRSRVVAYNSDPWPDT